MEIYKICGLPTIADDSGLMVDILDGAPGVYSSRFAGEEGNDAKNNAKLLQLLADVPWKETGKFVSVITMVFLPMISLLQEESAPGIYYTMQPVRMDSVMIRSLFPQGMREFRATSRSEEPNKPQSHGITGSPKAAARQDRCS